MTASRRRGVRAIKRVAAWTMTVALVIGGVSAAGSAASAAEAVPQSVSEASASSASAVDSVVKTADLSKFQAGNIISDAAFFNAGTMSEAQIQSFLQAKVPTCQSGYVCLKDWYDTSRTTSADAMCGAYAGGVRERASTIIFKVAQACGINPQVLLVMLQKEQGLVLHTWPSDWRYTIAMGQGCPDTAACDTRYYGFFNQVYGAAWQMKRYANPAGTSQYFTWYAPGKTWNVRWHPNEGCGSSPVYIQNQATANLYYYTPYQPNAAAIRAGYGEGDGCSSYGNRNFYQYFTDWFGATQTAAGADNPFGNIELVESRPGGFRVKGWVIDPNTVDSIEIHVYVGANGYAYRADADRPDVGVAYPAVGGKHGFDVIVPPGAAGPTNVCVYAINSGPGVTVPMGCVPGTAMTGSPVGNFESATGVVGGVSVSGWVLDPDSADSTEVHVYVGSAGKALVAAASRPDIAAGYPPYGANHGFVATIPAAPGSYQVCAYGINVGAGAHVPLGCRAVVVPGQPDAARPPIGNYEGLTLSGGTTTVSGWALDPDVPGPVTVRLAVNGVVADYVADKSRPDIAAAYPSHGPYHGFVVELAVQPGPTEVCAVAVNNAAGGDTALGCRTIAAAEVDGGRNPFGVFEALTVSGSTATASGWALDPDTSASIPVHLYVNGAGRAITADKTRDDVAAGFPGLGSAHGFVEAIELSAGNTDVCAYAINTGRGSHTLLGCRSVNVAAPSNRTPIGVVEGAVAVAGGASISGWTLDPDTTSPIEVHIYADGVGRAFLANLARPDVAAGYGLGSEHGFNAFFPLGAGSHRLCVYAINNVPGPNPPIGCRDVSVP